MKVRDKVVVVTGGASGIGRALCLRFAAEGARAVVVSDINLDGIDRTVAAIAGQTKVLGVRTDVGKEEEVSALVQSALEAHGQSRSVLFQLPASSRLAVRTFPPRTGRKSGISMSCPTYMPRGLCCPECWRGEKAIC